MMLRSILLVATVLSCLGQQTAGTDDEVLKQVAAVHGAPGVFAVAGFRIGNHALSTLGLKRGSFNLLAIHKSPAEVQWSCVADGVQAATGVSAGKLNLLVEKVPRENFRTVVVDRKSGRQLIYTIRPEFIRRFLDTPYDRQEAAARCSASVESGGLG